MPQLLFSFAELSRELNDISQFAEEYIRYDSTHVIPQLKIALGSISESDGSKSIRWAIPEESPLRTVTSVGQFEPDNEGGRNVFGEVSFVWDIQPVRDKGHQHGAADKVLLSGIASTRLAVFEELDDGRAQQLAMWRMEIGSTGSPGPCFHVQVLGQDDELPFPKFLPVPRLPTLMFTPMFAFDYLLGELFQDDWSRHISSLSASSAVGSWRTIQSYRLQKWLKWQYDKLEEHGATPWSWMKSLKPPSDLFLKTR